jgi:uncharacterized protein (TIGR02598 family)
MKKPRNKSRAGFSLVEVVIALGVTAFCLISILGLIFAGLQGTQQTSEQTGAVGIATDVIADLKATPTQGTPTSPNFGITIPTTATTTPMTFFIESDGSASSTAASPNFAKTPDQNARYRVSLGFPQSTTGRSATPVRVMITWPALADPNPGTWPTHYQGSWETVVNLDRN